MIKFLTQKLLSVRMKHIIEKGMDKNK